MSNSPITAIETTSEHIAVIGGGITGLTAAFRLANAGYRVSLWERSSQLGGLAAAIDVPGGQLEKFYHHLFMSDRAIVDLIDELGISDNLVWLESQNSFFSSGRTFSLASPLDLIRLPVVPFIDRIRVGLVTLYLQRISTASGRWKRFESVTAWEWLRRCIGQRAFDRMFGAQLRAKFGPRAEEVSMVWFWNKIFLRTQSRPGLFGREKLGYILGSFNALINALENANRELGATIHTNAEVERIDQESAQKTFDVVESDGRTTTVDRIIVTTPAPILLNLFPELPTLYREKLIATTYQGAVCVILRMNRSLSDTYWLNIADERMPFTVIVEHTNFVGPEHYEGNHYVYVNKYLDWDHPYVTMSDEDLIDEYTSYLHFVNPDFDRSWIDDVWVFRGPSAQPIIGLNYSQSIPDHRTPIPGVYLATMSQIYPEDRGTNYAVALGNTIAGIVQEDSDLDNTNHRT